MILGTLSVEVQLSIEFPLTKRIPLVYLFHDFFIVDTNREDAIRAGMDHISERTCITFREKIASDPYSIEFTRGSG